MHEIISSSARFQANDAICNILEVNYSDDLVKEIS
jgi:hypothetical protein